MLKIGELAKQTGLNASKIRFFEKEGVLTLGQRKANGYRVYPDEAIDVLLLITQAQDVGFTLKELRGLAATEDNAEQLWSHEAMEHAILEKLAGIEQIQKKLTHNQQKLEQILTEMRNKPPGTDCVANAKRILGVSIQNT
jgi:DNA-binding transcriptional MerR regulator